MVMVFNYLCDYLLFTIRIISWTSDGCYEQVDLKLHLSIGQVILFPYFDHWLGSFSSDFYSTTNIDSIMCGMNIDRASRLV